MESCQLAFLTPLRGSNSAPAYIRTPWSKTLPYVIRRTTRVHFTLAIHFSASGSPISKSFWLATLYVEPGYCESFNGKLRDECLNGEIFYPLKEAQVVIEKWRVVYNTLRPHSAPNPISQPMAVM